MCSGHNVQTVTLLNKEVWSEISKEPNTITANELTPRLRTNLIDIQKVKKNTANNRKTLFTDTQMRPEKEPKSILNFRENRKSQVPW